MNIKDINERFIDNYLQTKYHYEYTNEGKMIIISNYGTRGDLFGDYESIKKDFNEFYSKIGINLIIEYANDGDIGEFVYITIDNEDLK